MEIKNCAGHESDNRWRIACDDAKVATAPTTVNVTNRESLDIEVAKKVAMTITCLVGAHSKKEGTAAANELMPFADTLFSEMVCTDNKKLLVILFLEGDFSSKTRTKKTIMTALQDSIRKKLCWLNCNVSVVDSSSYNSKIFTLR